MRKAPKKPESLEMSPEYDFSKGIRGKYSRQYADGTNVVVIDPEVTPFFPDAKSVNDALRMLAKLIKQNRRKLAPGK